jgi:hypothetical protein
VATPVNKPKSESDQDGKQEDKSAVSEPRLDEVKSHSRQPAMNNPGLPVKSKREWIRRRKDVVAKNVLTRFQMKPEVRIVERFRGKEKDEREDINVEDSF